MGDCVSVYAKLITQLHAYLNDTSQPLDSIFFRALRANHSLPSRSKLTGRFTFTFASHASKSEIKTRRLCQRRWREREEPRIREIRRLFRAGSVQYSHRAVQYSYRATVAFHVADRMLLHAHEIQKSSSVPSFYEEISSAAGSVTLLPKARGLSIAKDIAGNLSYGGLFENRVEQNIITEYNSSRIIETIFRTLLHTYELTLLTKLYRLSLLIYSFTELWSI